MSTRIPTSHRLWHLSLRLGVCGVLASVTGAVFGIPASGHEVNILQGGLVAIVLATLLLFFQRTPLRALAMGVLAVHLLCVGTFMYLLLQQRGAAIDPRIPFVAGYVVAILVAVVGQRPTHTVLGTLAGAMVMALGLAFLAMRGSLPPSELVLLQFLVLSATAADAALVSGAQQAESARNLLVAQVERELRLRAADSAEQASLVQALMECSELKEVADALLAHLRCHLNVQVRSVALEADGQDIVVWEEDARLDGDDVERRRVRLQRALRDAGSAHVLRRLPVRGGGMQAAPRGGQLRTEVGVPIQAGGRVAGVLFLADSEAGAIPAQRIGLLADAARRVGEALQRMERLRGIEQRRTSLLLRQMREGVILLSPDGQVQMANPSAQAILDHSRMEGQESATHIGRVALRDLARTLPGAPHRFHTPIHPLGSEHILTIVGSALVLADGATHVGTLVTLSDVTEELTTRRRVEHAEKMTLVGQTLAGIAHELNNPLAALIGYADLLKNQEMPEAVRVPVSKMRDQAMRATRIVRNVMDFARRRNPERHPVTLAAVAQSVVELFAYEARIASVRMHLDVAPDLPHVLGDRHALQQVIVNLVQNALHALEGQPEPRAIHLRASVQDGRVDFVVSDTGPGVPADLRARIFMPFVTTKSANRGTGLGLAISRTIAREHGGDLLLDPPGTGGATFTLRLPAYTQASVAVQEATSRPTVSVGKVLVIDDEASVRESLVAQLGYLGSSVDSAGSASEAQRLLAGQRYDVVLLDLRMPGTGGIELHRELAHRNALMARRVIFMTGDFVNGDLLDAARATGNPLLEKPFTIEELAVAVERAASQNNLAAVSTHTA